ncbi:Multidrug resistance-like ATP-binding protein MdlB [Buchnera aphidicola (Thelaxes suberi)]|uniref:SmdB family multidrug efflux ABC transporter permease/ATP-binding protein n=1 Tax=Buchnera aphidicola TaxID=9 RepID=UPI0034643EC4
MKKKKQFQNLNFWNTLKRLLQYGVKWKNLFFYALMLLIFASFCEILSPLLISTFIKHTILLNKINKIFIFSLIISFIILQIGAAFLNYLESVLINKISVYIVQKIRTEVMQSALNQPIVEFDNQPIGQIIAKVTSDTEIIKELYDTVIPTFIRSFILIVIMIITIFVLSWKMALIASTIFPIVTIIMIVYQHYSVPLLRTSRNYFAEINNKFNEAISGMTVLQQFNQEYAYGKKIKQASYQHYLIKMKMLKLDGFLLRPLLSLLSSLVLCGLMTLISLFPTNIFEISMLYVFINYLGRLNEPLIAITNQQSILQQAIVSAERVFQLIDSPKQKYGNNTSKILTGTIKIKNLNFSYKQNNHFVLKNINFEILDKEFIALVGHTGSGKTTFANILMGYYPYYDGNINIDRKSLTSIHPYVLRKNISIVQQDPVIFADTIYNNITLGQNIPEKKIWNILKKIGLLKLVQEMPNKLSEILGEQGNNLSIGQKQLISLARILVIQPKILILDEATANIDSETELNIQKSLSVVNQYSTIISIAHRLSTIIHANRIIFFYKGEVKEVGNHYELMKKKGKYWNMYNLQSKKNAFFL